MSNISTRLISNSKNKAGKERLMIKRSWIILCSAFLIFSFTSFAFGYSGNPGDCEATYGTLANNSGLMMWGTFVASDVPAGDPTIVRITAVITKGENSYAFTYDKFLPTTSTARGQLCNVDSITGDYINTDVEFRQFMLWDPCDQQIQRQLFPDTWSNWFPVLNKVVVKARDCGTKTETDSTAYDPVKMTGEIQIKFVPIPRPY